MLTKNDLFFLFTIVSSFLFGAWLNPPVPFTKKDILRSIEATASSSLSSSPVKKNVLVGFNTNIDAVVKNGPEFLRSLVGAPTIDRIPAVTSADIPLQTKEDLAHIFAHHFKTSSAGERTILSDELWDSILQQVNSDDDVEMHLGGNAALMAEALKDLANVSLIGLIGPRLHAKLLPLPTRVLLQSSVPVKILSREFMAKSDEVHLILEYPGLAKFGKFSSSRANRFIVSRDFSNGVLAGVEELKAVPENVDLIIVAGVHLMEHILETPELQRERIRQVNHALGPVKKETGRVHFEFASTNELAFTKLMADLVEFESMGLNEQEFFKLCKALDICTEKSDEEILASNQIPNMNRLVAVTQVVFQKLPKVKRMHYHSYAFHFIAQQQGSSNERWPNAKQAVAAGSLRATLRACGVKSADKLHGNKLTMIVNSIKVGNRVLEVTKEDAVLSFTEGELDFVFVPVVACASPKQTVGLGDYISATALAKQL